MTNPISQNNDSLQSLIELLTERHQVILAMLCSERLLPCYKAYSVTEKSGDYSFLANSLNTLWEAVKNNDPLPTAQIRTWLERFPLVEEDSDDSIESLDGFIPDTEEVQSLLAELALDAICVFEMMLQSCLSTSIENTSHLTKYAIDVVYSYVAKVNNIFTKTDWTDGEDMARWWSASPLVVEEEQIIKQMAMTLSLNPNPGKTTIRELRVLARLNGIRPFGRGLVPSTARQGLKPTSPDLDFD